HPQPARESEPPCEKENRPMQTTLSQKTKQRQPKTRTARLTQTAGGPALVIHQRQGRQAVQVDAYFLSQILCQLGGRGFELVKHDGTRYHVRLDGHDSTCECRGFTRWNHCKHVESL